MNRLESVLLAGLTVAASALASLVYGGFMRPAPGPIISVAPTPMQPSIVVGPGWQMQPTISPLEVAYATAYAPSEGKVVAAVGASPPALPTPAWLQPVTDVSCAQLSQIAEAAMIYRGEALWASELKEAHVARARQTEPGAQLTRIHEFGTTARVYKYMLFSQALVVWWDSDPRVLMASPINGCPQGVNVPTPRP